jgi:hypothetical protein
MNHLHANRLLAALILGLSLAPAGAAQTSSKHGSVKGQVLDAETKQPLPGATVLLASPRQGTTTDADGSFALADLPVGSYVVQFSYVGYAARALPDVIVRSDRITTLQVELYPTVLSTDSVVVRAGFFPDAPEQPVSVTSFSAEEIRRAPGAVGDVSRIVNSLPSIAKVDDMKNSLVVRGGSPIENGFYVDNIEVSNINHFPTQGSSGGPIGLLHVDFIRDVDFSAGGFSAAYGDRLSSVMDITYREGNRDALDGQLDFNLAGLGLMGEGGFAGGKGSWLASARRSYLDLLVNTFFEDEADAVPTYSDYQAKVTYDVSPTHRITLLGLLGVDRSGIDREQAKEKLENAFGDADFTTSTAGINWRALWGDRGYSNTAVSHARSGYRIHFFKTATGEESLDNRSDEQEVRLRNVNHYRVGTAHRFEFGFDAKLVEASYDVAYGASTDPLGQPTPPLRVAEDVTAVKAGGFVSYSWRPLAWLTLTPGLRADHFTYTGNTTVSPRLSAALQLSGRTTLSFATGRYHQTLPTVLLAQHEAHRHLRDPVATHYVVSLQHLLAPHTRLTVELYHKDYGHFPLDPSQPGLFVIDQLFYETQPLAMFTNHEALVDAGRARTRGIEVMAQKKLARSLYGLVSGAYFRSTYRDAAGTRRDRVFDNRVLFNAEGGYKPNHRHEFSLRWTYAGGAPYTPFDLDASYAQNQGVFDPDRINDARLPDYHSLSLRYDRRFHFSSATLVAYLSVWNVYGRRNIATYAWNEVENQPEAIQQWGTLPILGLEFEF